MILHIKPFSVNKAWKGRRYRTDEYKKYKRDVLNLLQKLDIDFKNELSIDLVFGFSNSGSDIDNPLKPLLDIMQDKYKFNDNQIIELHIKKEKVKKGSEFIKIRINDM